MHIKAYTLLLSLAVVLFACQSGSKEEERDPFSHIQDTEAVEILRMALQQAGGLERWRKKRSLQFRKSTVLYEANGEVETMTDQLHTYQYKLPPSVQIEYQEDSVHVVLSSNYNEVLRTVDGRPDPGFDVVAGMNGILSATYVVSIPFKLLDAGTELTYQGIDTLPDQSIVHVIQAEFEPTTDPTEYDTWWHYFDMDSYRQVGYLVRHADHYSYIKNLSYSEVDGFEMVKDRRSFRADPSRNVDYLRATYQYSNYHFEF